MFMHDGVSKGVPGEDGSGGTGGGDIDISDSGDGGILNSFTSTGHNILRCCESTAGGLEL